MAQNDTAVGAPLDRKVRPLPAGAEIEHMGERATVVADNGGALLLVESDGIRQEWLWEFEGTKCVVLSMGAVGAAVPLAYWAPIPTAPKTGARILLYRAGFAEDVAVCWWSSDADDWKPVHGSAFPGATHWMDVPERPNVRVKLPAEADGAWPRKDNDHRGLERPGDGCRSGSA